MQTWLGEKKTIFQICLYWYEVLLCISMVNVPPYIEPSSEIYFYHMSRSLVSQIITVKGMKS